MFGLMDVYLASGNQHKFEEFASMVATSGRVLNFRSALEAGGMPEVDETGQTFGENAELKARALALQAGSGAYVLSDDSGLVVDALDGAPGIYSARYAGPGANAIANNLKLLEALRDVPETERTARFTCVLCFLEREGAARFFEGTCEGHILFSPSGAEGFGYDPLFRPIGHDRSFAELGPDLKNTISHRAKAVAAWLAGCPEFSPGA